MRLCRGGAGRAGGRVVTVEIVPELAALARAICDTRRFDSNVEVVQGDGSWGYARLAPYDAISVAAGAPESPCLAAGAIGRGGRLVIPVGDRDDQELRVVTKRDGRVESRVAASCRFVPLRGAEGWR